MDRAVKTSQNPSAPSGATISYGPSFSPGERGKSADHFGLADRKLPSASSSPMDSNRYLQIDLKAHGSKNETMDCGQLLATLRAHETELREAGVAQLSLFGSRARGDARPDSDVDLLASLDKSRRLSLLDVVCLEVRLADLLGVKVDLIVHGTLKPRVQQSVQRELLRAF
jgi:predicted nucleotidyltransferase